MRPLFEIFGPIGNNNVITNLLTSSKKDQKMCLDSFFPNNNGNIEIFTYNANIQIFILLFLKNFKRQAMNYKRRDRKIVSTLTI